VRKIITQRRKGVVPEQTTRAIRSRLVRKAAAQHKLALRAFAALREKIKEEHHIAAHRLPG